MQKKFIFLIITGITLGSIVGLVGYIVMDDLQQRGNSITLSMLTISLTPVPVRIEVQCSTSWEGSWSIGPDGGPESGGAGTYNFYGNISGIEEAVGNFKHTNPTGLQTIIVRIYINEQLKQNKTTIVFNELIGVKQFSPNIVLIPLAFIIGDMTVYG